MARGLLIVSRLGSVGTERVWGDGYLRDDVKCQKMCTSKHTTAADLAFSHNMDTLREEFKSGQAEVGT
jgi:hypothetical protein